jgi:hypothetical protein
MGRDLTLSATIKSVEDAWDDPISKAHVRHAVEAGLRDSDSGRTVSVEEVRARFGLSKSDSELEAWHEVYAGLPDDEVAEVEAVALGRSPLCRAETE